VACFATEQNMSAKLPQLLQGKAFIAIPGMRTLEDVNQYMSASLGADQYTGMARFWQVVPAQAKR
jgi:hypothetical protein